MTTVLLDQQLFAEILYKHHVELFISARRRFAFKAALFSWKRARFYKAQLKSLEIANRILLTELLNEANLNHHVRISCTA